MSKNSYSHCQAEDQQGILILTITDNELRDYDACNQLGRELEDAYHRSSCEHVAVDLVQVRYVSSVGYMPLLGLSGDVRRCGGRMVVFNMSELVANVFQSTRTLINPSQHDAPFHSAQDRQAAIDLLVSQ